MAPSGQGYHDTVDCSCLQGPLHSLIQCETVVLCVELMRKQFLSALFSLTPWVLLYVATRRLESNDETNSETETKAECVLCQRKCECKSVLYGTVLEVHEVDKCSMQKQKILHCCCI